MRLLFFNRSFYPDVEATGQLLTELCQDLSRNHDVVVIAGRGYNIARFGSWLPVRREQLDKIRILRAYNPRLNKKQFLGRVANLLSYSCFGFLAGSFAGRPDVVIVETDPPVLGLVGMFYARLYHAKFVFYIQDLYPDVGVALGKLRNPWLIKLLEVCTQWTLRSADRIVVLGEDMAARVKAKSCLHGNRIRVVPNWVDTTKVRPLTGLNPFRQRHQLEGKFVVMFSGNLGLSQDLERVVTIAANLANHGRIQFVFIGEGAAKAGLMNQAAELKVKNVRFLPYEPKETLGESLGAADVHLVTLKRGVAGLIVPSKAYGIMAAGRPFIAAVEEDTHIAQIIQEHACGIRVDPESTEQLRAAILRVAENPDVLETMGRRGREAAVTCFDRQVSVRKFRTLLTELRQETNSSDGQDDATGKSGET
ncbi:MAG: glycosyltransferase family 4 protein [Verrucomicrobiia bacterium]|jgi:glycosyltransferase involved in cell wall biosynthesis